MPKAPIHEAAHLPPVTRPFKVWVLFLEHHRNCLRFVVLNADAVVIINAEAIRNAGYDGEQKNQTAATSASVVPLCEPFFATHEATIMDKLWRRSLRSPTLARRLLQPYPVPTCIMFCLASRVLRGRKRRREHSPMPTRIQALTLSIALTLFTAHALPLPAKGTYSVCTGSVCTKYGADYVLEAAQALTVDGDISVRSAGRSTLANRENTRRLRFIAAKRRSLMRARTTQLSLSISPSSLSKRLASNEEAIEAGIASKLKADALLAGGDYAAALAAYTEALAHRPDSLRRRRQRQRRCHSPRLQSSRACHRRGDAPS